MPKDMRKIVTILLMAAVVFSIREKCEASSPEYDREFGKILLRLDSVIDVTADYDALKLRRIDSLRTLAGMRGLAEAELLKLNHELFKEYESMVCDSALHYINRCISMAETSGDRYNSMLARIEKASVVSKAGLFKESLSLLDSIDSATLPTDLRDEYFITAHDTYQYLMEYVGDTEYCGIYSDMIKQLNDSARRYVKSGTFIGDITMADYYHQHGDFDESYKYLEKRLPDYTAGTREYSVVASMLAHSALNLGDGKSQRRYLALSAISDIMGSVKENMAMRSLAEELYADGDIDRSSRYIQKSIEDANYYSARMRKNQSTRLLPLVDRAYKLLQEESTSQLRTYLGVISILTLLLVVAILFIFRQLNTVRQSHLKMSQARDSLADLNRELHVANDSLKKTNSALTEANVIKEEYIGRFMRLCSKCISALEQYRMKLYKLGASRKLDDLYAQLRSTAVVEDTLEEFYAAFDEAFLNIFPDFVEKFNALLPEEHRVTPRDGGNLNTELRVFALIRVGITDSAMIAEFLRCSISTIYTYRSKMKNRSLYRADFEAEVMKIGAVGA